MNGIPQWWAEGTLFENCNCASVCPAHVSFRQPCHHERCLGYWGFHIARGRWGELSLDGLNTVVAYDSPQLMIEGGWTRELLLDERGGPEQREALERIFGGHAGGGWAVVAGFFRAGDAPRYVPISVEEEGRHIRLVVGGVGESTLEWLKGVDAQRPVVIENLPNHIHGPQHRLAQGSSRFQAGAVRFELSRSNAITSSFAWRGP
jgi:hypothetical protein